MVADLIDYMQFILTAAAVVAVSRQNHIFQSLFLTLKLEILCVQKMCFLHKTIAKKNILHNVNYFFRMQ